MTCSLIISIYRNLADLKLVLEGLKLQSVRDFEIVVSEDGEDPSIRAFLETYTHPNPIRHLTQPDVGWRKNQALNNAIRKTTSDYLIFIDGDCLLHPRFVEHHLRLAAPDRVLGGKRVKLGPEYSRRLREDPSLLPRTQHLLLTEYLRMRRDGARFLEEGLYLAPEGWLGFLPRLRKMHQLKGCNMSFSRKAIEAINGFDEDYVLPAVGEDIDLTWRFQGLGYQLCSLRNLAVQYHLHHRENWSDQRENLERMRVAKERRLFRCLNGLTRATPA